MKTTILLACILGTSLLGACGPQSTPSMMNTSLPRLVDETALVQYPVEQVGQGTLYKISKDYERYGQGPLQLTLVYDPDSKTYATKKAFDDLARFKETLTKMGVRGVKGEALKANGLEPTLMVSYDSVKAQAPAGCKNMPGFDDGLTTRQIGDYRFGCSTDTLIAKQIYRPSDLRGNDTTEPGDGRRSANNTEYYRTITQQEAEGELRSLTRDDIQQ